MALTRNNASQQRLQTLEPALERRLVLLNEARTARRQGGFAGYIPLLQIEIPVLLMWRAKPATLTKLGCTRLCYRSTAD
ncbi:hypothetical protein [Leptolyngbya sp. FACHB-16]|uniref:hypothetical protein n=1 Tax=unclassified Leptolyngbya TaxID=2650499 RepID=UPI001683C58A|nr:hypothetical protein [Leptolyngbya sp. FACHB-16]MBD2155624.1 hypothetical protein [Leptolyngbya sp. FACHB-16]